MSREGLSERSFPAAERLLSTIAGQSLAPFGNGPKRPSILARWMTMTSRKKPKLSAVTVECQKKSSKNSATVEQKRGGKMMTIVEIEDSDDEDEFGEEEINAVGAAGGEKHSCDTETSSERNESESSIKPSIITVPNIADQSESSGTGEGMLISLSPTEQVNCHELERRPTTRHSLAHKGCHDTLYFGKKDTQACSAPDCPNCAVNDTSYCFLHERYGEFLQLEESNRNADNDLSIESDLDDSDSPLGLVEQEPLSLLDVLDEHVNEEGICPYIPTCMAITVEGTRCSMLPRPYNDYCSIHLNIKLQGTLKDLKDLNRKDRWFKGLPGTTMCRAITKRNSRCKHQSIALNDLCSLHVLSPPQRVVVVDRKGNGDQSVLKSTGSNDNKHGERTSYDGYRATLSESKDDESVSSDTSNTGRSSPYQYHEDDVMYSKNETEERCMYVSGKGTPCFFRAVKDSVYCHGHAHLLDSLNPALKKDYLSGASDEDLISSSDESSSSDCDDSSSNSNEDDPQPRPYNQSEFLTMWKKCEEYCGEVTDDIENTKKIRSANQAMCPEDTDGQAKAQYGRLLPRAMKKMIHKILALKADDIFLDIGHGIGNTCLQAAFTAGCEARGIEVVYGRNSVAEVFRDHMYNQSKEDPMQRIVGKVSFRHGRLEDEAHRDFLTKGVTRAYVNNFNGVFAERSSKLNQKWFLDDYVCGLFGLMEPGTILVTLHPLNLGPTQDEVNSKRRKHELGESPNASFFTVEKILLGKAYNSVKWNQHSGNENSIYVYKYTRLAQPAGPDAVFLCCNRDCEDAKNCTPIKAVTINEEGRCVMNHCRCKFSLPITRRQAKKNYGQ